jgi:Putative Ig domain/Prenyltransferase and squalene oxidase repeat
MLHLTSVHKLFVVVHAALLFLVASANAVTVDEARSKGLAWLASQQQGDGGFKSAFGLPIQTSAAALDAMRIGGLAKSPQFNRAIGWLSNAPASSLDARSWQIQSLSGAGVKTTKLAELVLDSRKPFAFIRSQIIIDSATWGPFPGYAPSSADTALAFGALRSGELRYAGDDYQLVQTITCVLLPAQLTASPWNGSWSYALPLNQQPTSISSGSLLATSLLTFELKQLLKIGRLSAGNGCGVFLPNDLSSALGNAKTWLLNQRNSDGGFAERNLQTGVLETSNVVQTSIAIRALQPFASDGDSASINAILTAQVWLANQQNADGSWRGDAFHTARAIAALPPAVGSQIADTDKDGLTDVVEQRLGTNITVADAQSNLRQNASAIPGLTVASFAVSGRVNESFNYPIKAEGGLGPFVFTLKAGSMPQGLSISPSGLISGIPIQSGTFAFDYQIRASNGALALVIGRLDIDEAGGSTSDGDVPLPSWALLLIGGGLLAALRRKS